MLAVLVYAQSRRSTGRAPPVTFATDVCLAHPPECDGPDHFTSRMLPRTYALRSGRRVEHHAGVSVMLVSKHGDTHAFDWSNLLHWSSAMLYSSLVVQSNSLELRARLRAARRREAHVRHARGRALKQRRRVVGEYGVWRPHSGVGVGPKGGPKATIVEIPHHFGVTRSVGHRRDLRAGVEQHHGIVVDGHEMRPVATARIDDLSSFLARDNATLVQAPKPALRLWQGAAFRHSHTPRMHALRRTGRG